MATRRIGVANKKKIRNLKQYRDMPNDEFEEIWLENWAEKEENDTSNYEEEFLKEKISHSLDFENRINSKIDEFSKDYDIDDLKINDRLQLRTLAQAFIQLEDLEQTHFRVRNQEINESNIAYLRDLNNSMASLRKDISMIQEDLKISRRARKGDKEENLITQFQIMQQKAKTFYKSKMNYIWCPKCKMLLGTIWVHYPESNNSISLTCGRTLDNGTKCGEKVIINLKDLVDKRGTNIDNVPEFFK